MQTRTSRSSTNNDPCWEVRQQLNSANEQLAALCKQHLASMKQMEQELSSTARNLANLKERYKPYIQGFEKFVTERTDHEGRAILITTTVFLPLPGGGCALHPETSSKVLYGNTLEIDQQCKDDQLNHMGHLGEWIHSLYIQNRAPPSLPSTGTMTSMKDYNRAMFGSTSDELFRLVLGAVDGNSQLPSINEFVKLDGNSQSHQ